MIITEKELTNKFCSLGLSNIKIAYIIYVNIIPSPYEYTNNFGGKIYLFDDKHFDSCKEILNKHSSKTPKSILKEKNIIKNYQEIFSQKKGLSNEAIATLNNFFDKKKGTPIEIPEVEIKDFFEGFKGGESRLKKIFEYLTTFKFYKIKLNPEEQLGILAQQAIAATVLPSKITEFYFLRFRSIDPTDPKALCLKHYVFNHWKIGWGKIDNELEIITKFFEYEPKLKHWSIKKALAYLEKIEKEYIEINKIIHKFHGYIDIDRKINHFIVHSLIYDKILSVLKNASERSKVNLSNMLNFVTKNSEILIKDKIIETVKGTTKV